MSFIHFGCWGNLNKDAKVEDSKSNNVNHTIPVLAVLEDIKKNIASKSNEIKFISVAGDNYYPDKFKKDKGKDKDKEKTKKSTEAKTEKKKDKEDKLIRIADVNTLMYQLVSLLDHKKIAHKPHLYLLYGNHEMIDNGYKMTKSDNELEVKNKQKQMCISLKSQLQYIHKNVHISSFREVLHEHLNHSTLVIMLDTTIYEDKDEKEMSYLKCYEEYSILMKQYMKNEFDNQKLTYKHLRLIQLMQVVGIINAYPKKQNLIFIGHHPILSFKQKKGENKLERNIGLENFFKRLNLITNDRLIMEPKSQLYYLCADTHLYEQADIELYTNTTLDGHTRIDKSNSTLPILIKQYIVGTGGTKLDKLADINYIDAYNKEAITYNEKNNNERKPLYKVDKDSRTDKTYGYLHVKSENALFNNINLNFIPVVVKEEKNHNHNTNDSGYHNTNTRKKGKKKTKKVYKNKKNRTRARKKTNPKPNQNE